MSIITDPARELVDICDMISGPSEERGEVVLARAFGVEPWSTEFFQIIFALAQKVDEVIALIDLLEMDNDIKEMAKSHVQNIKQSFTPNGLQNSWKNATKNYMSPEHIGPLRMLVPQIRTIRSYPKLEPDEVNDVLDEVGTLLTWLEEHQLADQDFVRQALIDGLRQFEFRLQKASWLGWGYTLKGLRDVISAYMALERGIVNPAASPDAQAVLIKTRAVVTSIFEKINVTKEALETGDFMLKAYGAVALLAHGKQSVAGLLTFAGS